jgi:3'-phosphoadenosine 5'-phosphosulfate sulfotransferase (PAPS reductase)/FAD synthetase
MQSLPLEAKERMTERRLQTWYESWNRYKLVNKVTGRVTYKASLEDPKLTKNQYIAEVYSGACYVSFSGGKDSTVLADLTARFCKRYGYKLVLLFVNTGLEYPEIQKHVKNFHKYLEAKYDMEVELVIKRPEMRFDQVLKDYGYPVISKEVSQAVREARIGLEKSDGSYDFRIQKFKGEYRDKNGNLSLYNIPQYEYLLEAPFGISEECCKVMKKDPAKQFERETGRRPIVGTMACESRMRRTSWIRFGCNAFGNKKRGPISSPLSFWTEQDVLAYIVKYGLPIASVYGQVIQDEKTGKYTTTGATRTGCVFCLFGAQGKGDCRFLSLKETHPRQYDYCINGGQYDESGKWIPSKEGLGLGKVLDYIGASDKY